MRSDILGARRVGTVETGIVAGGEQEESSESQLRLPSEAKLLKLRIFPLDGHPH